MSARTVDPTVQRPFSVNVVWPMSKMGSPVVRVTLSIVGIGPVELVIAAHETAERATLTGARSYRIAWDTRTRRFSVFTLLLVSGDLLGSIEELG